MEFKVSRLIIVIVLLVCLSSVVMADGSKRILTVGVEPGDNYMTVTSHLFGIIPRPTGPQMAVWIEDSEGNFVRTLFITETAAKARYDNSIIDRPEVLPVWSHSRGVESKDGYYMPTFDKMAADLVTGATPRGSSIHDLDLSEASKTAYIIRVEVNAAYDFNETYQKKLPKDNPHFNRLSGQPSLVYQTELEINDGSYAKELELIGHGHPAGRDGEIYKDMVGIDSALELLTSVEAGLIIE